MTQIFKQDGDRHEFFGHAVTIGIALATNWRLITAAQIIGIGPAVDLHGLTIVPAVASVFATLYLSPDVDQVRSRWKSKSLHRWKRLRLLWVWRLFRLFPGTHHRGITHVPIVGALVVLAWVSWPLLLALAALPISSERAIALAAEIAIPCVVQQLTHLVLD